MTLGGGEICAKHVRMTN